MHYNKNTNTPWELFQFSIKTGISSIIKNNRQIGLKQVLDPLGYWRFPIFPIVIDALGDMPSGKILDLGSPKILSLYLALLYGYEVYATDIQDPQLFNRYKYYYDDYLFHKLGGKYVVELQDARLLSYPDNSFDFVYSISVIEHIPDEGDLQAMKEIARVLKNGGKAVVEVPYAPQEKETFVNRPVYERTENDNNVFYQRHYSPSSLAKRLIEPSGMQLIDKIITAEKIPFEYNWERIPYYVKRPLRWAESLVSYFNHYNWSESREKDQGDVHKRGLGNRKQHCALSSTLIFKKIT